MSLATGKCLKFTIPQAQLANGLASVIHAMHNESSRYAIAGVRVVIMPGEITFVATDGQRMAWRRIEIDHGLDPIEFTIPAKEAKTLARMYSGGSCTICIDGQHELSIRKIDVKWRNGKRKDQTTSFEPLGGRYPNWQDVVCGEEHKLRVGEISGPANLLLPFFAPEDCVVMAVGNDASVTAPIRSVRGRQAAKPAIGRQAGSINHAGEFSVCVNRGYMSDVLCACGGNITTIKVSDPDSAVFIECENGLRSVVMPRSDRQ